MINITIQHRKTGEQNLEYNYEVTSQLYIHPDGKYFEYDSSNPISIVRDSYITAGVEPEITFNEGVNGGFLPEFDVIYETNDDEIYDVIITVNYDGAPDVTPDEPTTDEDGNPINLLTIKFNYYLNGILQNEYYPDYLTELTGWWFRFTKNENNLSLHIEYGDATARDYNESKSTTSLIGNADTNYPGTNDSTSLNRVDGIDINNLLDEYNSVNSTNPLVIDIYFDKVYHYVHFSSNDPKLGIIRAENGSSSVENSVGKNDEYIVVEHNKECTLTAFPSENAEFKQWETDSNIEETNPWKFNVTSDRTIVGIFESKIQPEEPEIPSDRTYGKIATNEDIYNASNYIYKLNDNQCPAKKMILENCYGAVNIAGANQYANNQCVVFNDLTYKRVFDNIKLINDCGVTLDAFGIYFAYDEPNDSNTYDFLSYEFEDDVIKKNTTTTLSKKTLDISKIGDYRNKTMYFGFWSKKWEGSKRSFTFNINGKIFKTEDVSHAHVGKTDSGETISVIDFLREYYNNVIITITQN